MQFSSVIEEEEASTLIRGAANLVSASASCGCLINVKSSMRSEEEAEVVLSVRGKAPEVAEAVLAIVADMLTNAPNPLEVGGELSTAGPFYHYDETE